MFLEFSFSLRLCA